MFTNDLNHVVVAYYGGGSPDPNYVVVWELDPTPSMVKVVTFNSPERPWVFLPGSYPGNLWVASEGFVDTDAGSQDVVYLTDVAQPTPTKSQAILPAGFGDMVFTPDGKGLAIGLSGGGVSLWDITDKTNITRTVPPLIPAGTSGTSVFCTAFTKDGQFFAAGFDDWSASFVKLTSLAQRQPTQRTISYIPWALAFAPDGSALAIGERSYAAILYCTP